MGHFFRENGYVRLDLFSNTKGKKFFDYPKNHGLKNIFFKKTK